MPTRIFRSETGFHPFEASDRPRFLEALDRFLLSAAEARKTECRCANRGCLEERAAAGGGGWSGD